ncbi:MAG: hypothetical protein WC477_06935 [Patescibacteria group bacterium]
MKNTSVALIASLWSSYQAEESIREVAYRVAISVGQEDNEDFVHDFIDSVVEALRDLSSYICKDKSRGRIDMFGGIYWYKWRTELCWFAEKPDWWE